MLNRRGFIGSLLAAPFIVRTPGLLMPINPALASRAPHELYCALYTLDGQEVSGGGYARLAVPEAGQPIVFPAATESWGSVIVGLVSGRPGSSPFIPDDRASASVWAGDTLSVRLYLTS